MIDPTVFGLQVDNGVAQGKQLYQKGGMMTNGKSVIQSLDAVSSGV